MKATNILPNNNVQRTPSSSFGLPALRQSGTHSREMPFQNSSFTGSSDATRHGITINESPILLNDEDLTNLQQIGQGHFAKVYKALLHGKNPVAVKELKQGSTSGSLETLMKEVRVMLTVRHPNIIHFYGIVFDKMLVGRSSSASSFRLVSLHPFFIQVA